MAKNNKSTNEERASGSSTIAPGFNPANAGESTDEVQLQARSTAAEYLSQVQMAEKDQAARSGSSHIQSLSDVNGSEASTPAEIKRRQTQQKSSSQAAVNYNYGSNAASTAQGAGRTSSRASKNSLQRQGSSVFGGATTNHHSAINSGQPIASATSRQNHSSCSNMSSSRQHLALQHQTAAHQSVAQYCCANPIILKDLSPKMKRYEPIRTSQKRATPHPSCTEVGKSGASSSRQLSYDQGNGQRDARGCLTRQDEYSDL